MTKKNNNDILKTIARTLRKAGQLQVSPAEINSAGREKLVAWLASCNVDADEALRKHREAEEGSPAPAAPAPAAPATPATPAGDVAQQLAGLLAQLGGRDAELREQVDKLQQQVATLSKSTTREVEVIQPSGEKVNVGRVHKCFDDLLLVASCRLHAFLTGAAGSFKTSSAEKVAEALELEYSSISVCQQTTAAALLGYMNAQGGYVPTEFRARFEQGGVFILDEIDNGNANVLAVLNSALANGACAFPDGMVKRHKDFILIATANTFGTGANAQYVGRNKLDAATLDRFAFIEWDYDEELEREIARYSEWADYVLQVRRSVEKLKLQVVISPRATFNGNKLIAAGASKSRVAKMLLWKGLTTEQVSKIKANI